MLCGCHGNLDETGQCRCRQLGQVSANAERENRRTERTDCPPPRPLWNMAATPQQLGSSGRTGRRVDTRKEGAETGGSGPLATLRL